MKIPTKIAPTPAHSFVGETWVAEELSSLLVHCCVRDWSTHRLTARATECCSTMLTDFSLWG